MEEERTNVTFSLVVLAFNQERYIREAVESALAQDYEGDLEIVITDDCSQDSTWDIINQMVKAYTGPHKVIVNRNDQNLGIVRNFQKGVSLSSGTWIIVLAGDDLAFPNRVSYIHSLVRRSPGVFAVGTACEVIDADGRLTGRLGYRVDKLPELRSHILLGATAAYRIDCFHRFPSLDYDLQTEDVVYPFRALLLGKIVLVNTPTLSYRLHSGGQSMSNGSHEIGLRKMIRLRISCMDAYRQRILDLSSVPDIPHQLRDWLIDVHDRYIAEDAMARDRLEKILHYYSLTGLRRLRYLLSLRLNGSVSRSLFYKCKLLGRQSGLVSQMYRWIRNIVPQHRVRHRRHIPKEPEVPIIVSLHDYFPLQADNQGFRSSPVIAVRTMDQ